MKNNTLQCFGLNRFDGLSVNNPPPVSPPTSKKQDDHREAKKNYDRSCERAQTVLTLTSHSEKLNIKLWLQGHYNILLKEVIVC